jgi:hypothetical protein
MQNDGNTAADAMRAAVAMRFARNDNDAPRDDRTRTSPDRRRSPRRNKQRGSQRANVRVPAARQRHCARLASARTVAARSVLGARQRRTDRCRHRRQPRVGAHRCDIAGRKHRKKPPNSLLIDDRT